MIDTKFTNVIVKESETDTIQLAYEENDSRSIEIETLHKELSIATKTEIRLFSFDWMEFARNETANIILQVPKAYAGDVIISTTYGEVNVSDIKAIKKLAIDAMHGQVAVHNVETETMDIDSEYGEVSIEKVKTKAQIDITNHHRQVSLYNIEALSLDINTTYSDIELEEMKIKDTIQIDNKHGFLHMDEIENKTCELDIEYGEILSKEWKSDIVDIDIMHGDVSISMMGKEMEYHIESDVEFGVSNVENRKNKDTNKRFSLTGKYSDVQVDFMK